MLKKIVKSLSLFMLALPCMFLLVACGNGAKSAGEDIEGITYTSVSYCFDNTEKELLITGSLPDGVSVEYSNNKGTNAGTYNAQAVMSGEGYKTKTLSATLTITKATYDMSNAKWDYTSAYTYDGSEKSVVITGLPSGVTVNQYSNNAKTNAGSYVATASLSFDQTNYNAPSIGNCSWKIEKADISGITFQNDSVEYDTLSHSIYIVGNVPNGVITNYTYDGENVDGEIEVGKYTVVATLSGDNYNTLSLTATLTITSTEETLYCANSNGTIYFQNNLDDNKLYKVGDSNIEKVNNDIPKYLVSDGTNLYYYSSSIFSSVIKCLTGSTSANLCSVNGEYLTTDGTYIYYAINNLLFDTDKNGIYMYKLDGSSTTATRLTTDKATFLTYYNGYLYYANQSESSYLYSISISAIESKGTLIRSEAVSYLTISDGVLYFNSSNGLAKAIYKYNISASTTVKLTTDNGKYLTKIGSYIYYINSDWLTSNLFGKGIYKASVLATEDCSDVGTKILEATGNNGYSSLSGDGTYLYYYKLNDKHFYKYNVSLDEETDLMENFVVQDDSSALSGTLYGKLCEYNGEIYYTNPLDNGCLYKYNVKTKAKYKVLADSVSNICFNDNFMYYSTYVVTNYALFKMNLQTKETTKISSSRCDNLIFDGDYIYYIKVGSAYNNYLMKMKNDGTEVETLYSGKNLYITSLSKVGDNIYFCINPQIGYKYIYSYSLTSKAAVSLEIKSDKFVVENNIIYYYEHTAKQLKSYDIESKTNLVLQSNVEINYMFVSNGKIYYSSTSSQNTGLYQYEVGGQNSALLSKVAEGIIVSNGTLYYLQGAISYLNDYPSYSSDSSDGHLYSLVLETKTETKLA